MTHVLGILRKDLLIEWRARTRALALASFAFMLLLLFSFAVGPDTKVLQQHASAYLWMSILLSSTLLLAASFQQEVEAGALEAVLLAPVEPSSLFYGKALANALQLLLLGGFGLVVSVVMFDAAPRADAGGLAASLFLGAAGLAAPGTLYAAMTARIQARQLLMPLLLFPLIVPALLASVKATSLSLLGDPMDQTASWLALLGSFDLIYWSLCGVLFGKVMDT